MGYKSGTDFGTLDKSRIAESESIDPVVQCDDKCCK